MKSKNFLKRRKLLPKEEKSSNERVFGKKQRHFSSNEVKSREKSRVVDTVVVASWL